MHDGFANDNGTGFLPLLHTPRGASKLAGEVEFAAQGPSVSFHMYFILNCDGDAIHWTQWLAIFVSLCRSLCCGANLVDLRFKKGDRVLAGWFGIAADQREQGLDDGKGSQLARSIASYIVGRSVVSCIALSLLRGNWQVGSRSIRSGYGDHGRIIAGGVLVEREVADDIEASGPPEMALDKADILNTIEDGD